MTSSSTIAEQRDRFLAFAFAAADILIEVDDDGRIIFVTGTMNAIFGRGENDLLGLALRDLAAGSDTVLVDEYLHKLIRIQRAREHVISFVDTNGNPVPLVVSGMANPSRIGVNHLVLRRFAPLTREIGDPREVMPSKEFAALSAGYATQAKSASESLNLAMYEMDWAEIETVLSQAEAEGLSDELVQIMRVWAYGGTGVGHINPGKYSVLLDEDVNPDHLADRLRDVASERTPDAEPRVGHASLPLDDFSDREQFESFFNKAMQVFDEMGAEDFDFADPDAVMQVEPPKLDDSHEDESQRPARLRPTQTNVRRKGETESWS